MKYKNGLKCTMTLKIVNDCQIKIYQPTIAFIIDGFYF